MFLDRGQSIDALVVGEAFVVVGHQAADILRALFNKDRQSQMPVEQEMLALTTLHWRDNERLDYSDLVDGMGDPLVLDRLLERKADGPQRQDRADRQNDDLPFEGSFDRRRHYRPPVMPIRSANGRGIDWIASARSRVVKCSSATRRRNALTMNSRRL